MRIIRGISENKTFPYIVFFVVIYAVYLKSVMFGITELDDASLVIDRYAYLKDPFNIVEAFFKSVFGKASDTFYRPVLTASWIVDTLIGNGKIWFYHFSNIALHFAAVSILFNVLKRLSVPEKKAVVFSVFFAILPVLNQAVSWIPGRNDLLLAIFIFSSFFFVIKYNAGGRIKYLFAAAFLFLASLFTKESAAPALILFPAYLALNKTQDYKKKIIALSVSLLVCCAVLFFMRTVFANEISSGSMLSFFKAGAYKLVPATLQYVSKIFLPVNLKVMPLLSVFDSLLGFFMLLVLAFFVLRSKNMNRKNTVFGILWFTVFLLPTYFQSNFFMLEHRLYTPLLGMILVLSEIKFDDGIKKIAPVLLCFYALFFAAVSFVNNKKFENQTSFAVAALTETRDNVKTDYLYARTFLKTGYFSVSDRYMKKTYDALSEKEKRKNSLNAAYAGIFAFQRGDMKTAKEYLIAATEKQIELHEAYACLASIYMREGRYDKALESIKKAYMLDTGNKEYYKYLAICFNLKNSNK